MSSGENVKPGLNLEVSLVLLLLVWTSGSNQRGNGNLLYPGGINGALDTTQRPLHWCMFERMWVLMISVNRFTCWDLNWSNQRADLIPPHVLVTLGVCFTWLCNSDCNEKILISGSDLKLRFNDTLNPWELQSCCERVAQTRFPFWQV